MGIYIKNIVKKIIFSFVTLYTVGIVLNFLGVFLPINIYTLLVTCFLGFPGVISIVMVFIFLL